MQDLSFLGNKAVEEKSRSAFESLVVELQIRSRNDFEAILGMIIGLEILSLQDPEELMDIASKAGYPFPTCPILRQNTQLLFKDAQSINNNNNQILSIDDLILYDADQMRHVQPVISPWLVLDSADESIRSQSELLLKQQCEWVKHCGVSTALIHLPSHDPLLNFSKSLNDAIHALGSTFVLFCLKDLISKVNFKSRYPFLGSLEFMSKLNRNPRKDQAR
jgi:hypothetical protein